jgi:hypothetical protein
MHDQCVQSALETSCDIDLARAQLNQDPNARILQLEMKVIMMRHVQIAQSLVAVSARVP